MHVSHEQWIWAHSTCILLLKWYLQRESDAKDLIFEKQIINNFNHP